MEFNAAYLSGTLALTGALLGQWLNNRYTNQRENKKYLKEVYQELFSPIILDVFAYYDIRTNFRRAHDIKDDINEDEVIHKIHTTIESNIKYAGKELISSVHSLKRNEYYEDFKGGVEDNCKINLCVAFLEEFLINIRETKVESKKLEKLALEYKIKYYIWFLLGYYNFYFEAAMKYMWIFDFGEVNESYYQHLKIRFENVGYENFLDVLEEELASKVRTNCMDMFQESFMRSLREGLTY
ncbi:hypothetical protein [Rossellomorea yichunensis]|uniref:hypothetical protein n=1 Tax=Rossellomorea yichunensis TaxID=3077331 RepID=UPI0028DD5EE3|nr:hypothetical protein [Rossellomorea sp. YC4-1]MDT9025679.1 hypothetical protein [Rossellomorea sp. YC4-1]